MADPAETSSPPPATSEATSGEAQPSQSEGLRFSAVATGQKVDDQELLGAALEMGKQMIGPDLRAPGVFDAEQPCPAGASTEEQLLAFAGRKV